MYRVSKPNPYQDLANDMPIQADDAGIVFVGGRPAFEPRDTVGMSPGYTAESALNADNVNEGPDAIRAMVREDAWAAADYAYASEMSQTLQLTGLGRAVAYARPSGSLLRNVRVARIPSQQERTMMPSGRLGRLGAVDWLDGTDWVASCANFDIEKYGPPVVGFLFQKAAAAPTYRSLLDAAAAVFGPQPVGCVRAASMRGADATGSSAIMRAVGLPASAAGSGAAGIAAGIGMSPDDAVKAAKAAARMEKLGRWTFSSWDTSWWLLSGYTPFYTNPLVLATTALAGMGGYWLLKRKRRK